MQDNEKEAVSWVHEIVWREGTTRLQAALPPPFKLVVKDEGHFTDVGINIEDDGDPIWVFSGRHYNSRDVSGGFREEFEWARLALAGFFAALPTLHASAVELYEQRREREHASHLAETKKSSDRAREIYQTHLTPTR